MSPRLIRRSMLLAGSSLLTSRHHHASATYLLGQSGWAVLVVALFVVSIAAALSVLTVWWFATSLLGLSRWTMTSVLERNAWTALSRVITLATRPVVLSPIRGVAPGTAIPIMPLGIATAKSDCCAGYLQPRCAKVDIHIDREGPPRRHCDGQCSQKFFHFHFLLKNYRYISFTVVSESNELPDIWSYCACGFYQELKLHGMKRQAPGAQPARHL